MNKTQEALKMAIDALEDAQDMIGDGGSSIPDYFKKHINACKEALAECEQVEPVITHIDAIKFQEALNAMCVDKDAKIAELQAHNKELCEANEWLKNNPRTDIIEAYETKINSLESHINELRDALEVAKPYVSTFDLLAVEHALTKTPAQNINDDVVIFDKKSLQAHDDEVIERCAKVCENNDGSWADYIWNDAVDNCARQIRALKHTS